MWKTVAQVVIAALIGLIAAYLFMQGVLHSPTMP
jgi:hypothetical protein